MTHPLIEQLRRLDAEATKGPWSAAHSWAPRPSVVDEQNVYGSPPTGVVAKVVRASQDGKYTAEKKANADLIEFFGTHRARILAMLEAGERLAAAAAGVVSMEADDPVQSLADALAAYREAGKE